MDPSLERIKKLDKDIESKHRSSRIIFSSVILKNELSKILQTNLNEDDKNGLET